MRVSCGLSFAFLVCCGGLSFCLWWFGTAAVDWWVFGFVVGLTGFRVYCGFGWDLGFPMGLI